MDKRYEEAVGFVAPVLRQPLLAVAEDVQGQIHEIRLRAGHPIVLTMGNQCKMLGASGELRDIPEQEPLICSYECLEQTFRSICGYSVHTHQREMIRGYISLKGGHRAGLAATVVERDGAVTSIKELSSINLRIARQILGASHELPSEVYDGGLLLVGGPGSGKTTLLRDIARQLSGDRFPRKKVVILDERGELAAMWDGMPQNDVGINTDVLNGFSKEVGMEMAIRSLSPHVVICDEIGSRQDARGLWNCLHAGVEVVASVHAGTWEELYQKTWVMELLRGGVFDHLVLLNMEQGKSRIQTIVRTDEWLNEMAGNRIGGCGNELLRQGSSRSV